MMLDASFIDSLFTLATVQLFEYLQFIMRYSSHNYTLLYLFRARNLSLVNLIIQHILSIFARAK